MRLLMLKDRVNALIGGPNETTLSRNLECIFFLWLGKTFGQNFLHNCPNNKVKTVSPTEVLDRSGETFTMKRKNIESFHVFSNKKSQ